MRKRDLTVQEQHELCIAWQQRRDATARSTLFNYHYPLVLHLARKTAIRRNMKALEEDYVQEGSLGMLRAIDKFDVDRGVQFSTYAGIWIKAFMDRSTGKLLRLIRYSKTVDARALSSSYGKIVHRCLRIDPQLEGEALTAAVAKEAQVSLTTVRNIEEERRGIVRLDAPRGAEEGKATTLLDSLKSTHRNPEEELNRQEVLKLAALQVSTLPVRTQKILEQRLIEDSTLQELGDEYFVSRERIRQVEKKAILKLQRQLCDVVV